MDSLFNDVSSAQICVNLYMCYEFLQTFLSIKKSVRDLFKNVIVYTHGMFQDFYFDEKFCYQFGIDFFIVIKNL